MFGIVLCRRNFREADQIIFLYTLEQGKIEVLARGVKKITSKNSAHLEPFSYVDAEIIPGKELQHLGAVQPLEYFPLIRQDLQKSLVAGFVVNLLNKILHEGEKDERVFNLLKSWLVFLNLRSTTCHLQLVDGFIVKLLDFLGFDITETKNLGFDLRNDLVFLKNSSWEQITSYQLLVTSSHQIIYNFFVNQLERKIEDWQKLILA